MHSSQGGWSGLQRTHLDAAGAAWQAELEDEVVLTDQADWMRLLVRRNAALLLKAEALIGALAANEDVIGVNLPRKSKGWVRLCGGVAVAHRGQTGGAYVSGE